MKRLTDILQAQGLSEDQITAISKAMKDGKVYVAGEENLDVRYGKTKQELATVTAERDEGARLIEQLQKANKGNESLQQAVAGYQQQIANLQAELTQSRLEYALRVQLMSAEAEDVDYLVYKALEAHPEWREHPENAMDEAGQIKGADDLVAGLKTKHPTQFRGGQPAPKVEPQPLPKQDERRDGFTRSDILRMSNAERTRLYNDDPESYRAAMRSK